MIRFSYEGKPIMAAVTDDLKVYQVPYGDFLELIADVRVKKQPALELVKRFIDQRNEILVDLDEIDYLLPVEVPEVWAAGVTYEKSKHARNFEATSGKLDSLTFYDKVYDAERPEIFFKSTLSRTVGPKQAVALRSDSRWQIPEPELGLVLSREGEIIGYTIGNDMSCRDIEGENPLYLPQAKVWNQSCAIGPAIRLKETVENPYALDIICRIIRGEALVFEGQASTSQLKRKLVDLVSYLMKDNIIPDGTILLTGTCIIPPDDFCLTHGDVVEIEISGIGLLRNYVIEKEKVVHDSISQSKGLS